MHPKGCQMYWDEAEQKFKLYHHKMAESKITDKMIDDWMIKQLFIECGYTGEVAM